MSVGIVKPKAGDWTRNILFRSGMGAPSTSQTNSVTLSIFDAAYARMAPQTPPVWDSPYSTIAEGKVNEVFERAAQYYERHGEQGLREVIQRELTAGSNYVKRVMDRNVLAGAP